MRAHILLGLTATTSAVCLALAGCASPVEAETFHGEKGQGVADSPADEAAKEAQESAGSRTPPGALAFGETAKWDDGLALTLVKTDIVKAGEDSASDNCKAGDPVQLFEITIENGSSEPFDPTQGTSFDAVAAQDDGSDQEADQVFDSDNALNGIYSMAPIRPGRNGSTSAGFCMQPGTQEFVIRVSPSFISDDGEITERSAVTFSESGTEEL